MITVAHLINNIVQSGPVIVMRDIIRHMDRDKFRPIVICLRHEDKEDPIVKELRAIDVKCIYLNCSLLSLELQTGRIARKVLSVLHSEKAHILHSHGYHPDLIASQLSGNIRCVNTFHNISKDDFSFLKGRLYAYVLSEKMWQKSVIIFMLAIFTLFTIKDVSDPAEPYANYRSILF